MLCNVRVLIINVANLNIQIGVYTFFLHSTIFIEIWRNSTHMPLYSRLSATRAPYMPLIYHTQGYIFTYSGFKII